MTHTLLTPCKTEQAIDAYLKELKAVLDVRANMEMTCIETRDLL